MNFAGFCYIGFGYLYKPHVVNVWIMVLYF